MAMLSREQNGDWPFSRIIYDYLKPGSKSNGKKPGSPNPNLNFAWSLPAACVVWFFHVSAVHNGTYKRREGSGA